MDNDFSYFEEVVNKPCPDDLKRLYEQIVPKYSSAIEFIDNSFDFSLEIQYFKSMMDSNNYSIQDSSFCFAVDSDGYRLIIYLNSNQLEIHSEQYGDIVGLDWCVSDLLTARIEIL